MIRRLPTYKGYTVDMMLQEFRKVPFDKLPEFIPFTSKKGASLLKGFIKTEEGQKELDYYWSNRC